MQTGSILGIAAAVLLGGGGAPQPPDQFLLVDALHTHSLETKGFSYFPLTADVPDNWKAPVNFYEGAIHVRLEVISKPSEKPVNLQLCVFQDKHSSDKHS